MQKSDVPEVTCIDCSPVEVVVGEELFALTREEIETGHRQRVNAKKEEREKKKTARRIRKSRDKDRNISSILSMSFSLPCSSAV